MQLHGKNKVDAIALKSYTADMSQYPSEIDVTAWARLVRASNMILEAVEADLKRAGFPPLAWYDVLLELRRVPDKTLRPVEIERRSLLAQYNVSRLLDRMAAAGYVEKLKSEADGRGVLVRLTPDGVEVLSNMWPIYAAGIKHYFSSGLEEGDAEDLAVLLAKLLPDRD